MRGVSWRAAAGLPRGRDVCGSPKFPKVVFSCSDALKSTTSCRWYGAERRVRGPDVDGVTPTRLRSIVWLVLRAWRFVAVALRGVPWFRHRSLARIEREELDRARMLGSPDEIAMWIDRIDRRRDRMWGRIADAPNIVPGFLVLLAFAVSPLVFVTGILAWLVL